jgi:hypothetical protein
MLLECMSPFELPFDDLGTIDEFEMQTNGFSAGVFSCLWGPRAG